MKNYGLLTLLAAALLLPTSGATAANTVTLTKAADSNVLRLYNWEDYIYEDEETGESMMSLFEEYYQEKYGESITVEYYTFDTNESMYSHVVNLSEQYDLICPSDYMIDRMGAQGHLETMDTSRLATYNENVSPYLKTIFENNGYSQYAAGYMWGTMGLIYNPERVEAADMATWESLWDSAYKNLISIKDSMRDTYVVGIFHIFKDAMNLAKEIMDFDPNDGFDVNWYNALISEYFNRCDEDTMLRVEEALKVLKKNIYGFEVDSGKNDIVTGKIAINLAWSGDAVASMDTAEAEEDMRLYYSVPEEGSNIWFDGWCMPKGANQDLAYEFLNFISLPENAVLNMDYIGYTSAIAGEDVLDRIIDLYSTDDEEETYDVDLNYFFGETIEGRDATITIPLSEKGRQFDAQYPSEEVTSRCAIMKDFGPEGNERLVNMWMRVKATELNFITYVFIGIIILGCGGYLVFAVISRNAKKKRRQARLAQHKA